MDTINITLSEKVFEILRERILTGVLKPNDRLLYAAIAKELGVSLSPVKEALLSLAQEGLVTINPRRGVFVCKLSGQDIVEYSWIRLSLESLAVEKACESGVAAQDVAKLREINEKLKQSVASRDVKQCMLLDNEFHMQIVQMSRVLRLNETVRKLPLANLTVAAGSRGYVVSNGQKIYQTHCEIIEALARQDAETAKALLKKNIISPIPAILASGDESGADF